MFKNLLLAVLSTCLALLLGEGVVRAMIVVLHKEPIVVSDPRTGWAGRPGLSNVDVSMGGGHFRVSTDQMGRRVLGPSQADTTTAPAIVLLGDSFGFGLAANDRDTYPWQLSELMKDRYFVNLGVPGWGSDQELLALEHFLGVNATRHVSDVVVLVCENDFSDVQRPFDTFLGRRKPVFRTGPGGLETGTFQLSWADRLMDHSRLTWVIRSKLASLGAGKRIDPAAGEDVVVASLERIRQVGASRGARVHVFAHRRIRGGLFTTEATWASFLTRSRAIDITNDVRSGGVGDPVSFDGSHWSAEGNRRAALVIRRAL